MVAPGAGFCGVTLCDVTLYENYVCVRVGEEQKNGLCQKIGWVFRRKVSEDQRKKVFDGNWGRFRSK